VTSSSQWQSQIWDQYRSNLQALLRAKVNNAADAEDLLQDIMLKAHSKLGSLRDQSNLKAWLMQIARNSITDFYRAKGKHTHLQAELAQDYWQIDDDLPAAQQDLSQCVRPFIQALSADKAKLLTAIDLEGQAQKQLAQELGISYSTLKSRVQRARIDLRQLFESCCSLELDAQGQVMDYDGEKIAASPRLLLYGRLGLNKRKRLALVTTVTEDKDMAKPANMGLNNMPVNGNKTPAATGIPKVL